MKTAAVIQARLGSSRLPGKVLLPFPFDTDFNILDRIVIALNSAALFDFVIVATSTNLENDAIELWANKNGVLLHRGSENNVLQRFCEVINKFELSTVCRFTADNPFVDLDYLRIFLEKYNSLNVDYAYTDCLPLGMNFEVVSADKLIQIDKLLNHDDIHREHVTSYLLSDDKYKSKCIPVFNEALSLNEEIRLTIDYPSDYALCSVLASKIYFPYSLKTINDVFLEFKWLLEINNSNAQKTIL